MVGGVYVTDVGKIISSIHAQSEPLLSDASLVYAHLKVC